MKHARWMLGSAFVLAILCGGPGVAEAADQPVKRTELLRADITNVEGREGVAYIAEIVPGGVGGKHTHPGDEFVYMLEGSIIIEPEGKEPVTVKAGETMHLPEGLVHSARNGSDSAPAKALVFLVSQKGKPLAEAME